MKNTKFKRFLTGLLCCLMLFGLMPGTAFAYTAEKGVPYFDFSYESDGTEIMYHDSFSLGGYLSRNARTYKDSFYFESAARLPLRSPCHPGKQ